MDDEEYWVIVSGLAILYFMFLILKGGNIIW